MPVCTNAPHPFSVCALKEAFLAEGLAGLKGFRTKFRYSGGSASVQLDPDGNRIGIITLTGVTDEEDPEYSAFDVEIRESGVTLHAESIPFNLLHPLVTPTPEETNPKSPDHSPNHWAPELYAGIETDSTNTPRLVLRSHMQDGSLRPVAPLGTWMGPVLEIMRVWGGR